MAVKGTYRCNLCGSEREFVFDSTTLPAWHAWAHESYADEETWELPCPSDHMKRVVQDGEA